MTHESEGQQFSRLVAKLRELPVEACAYRDEIVSLFEEVSSSKGKIDASLAGAFSRLFLDDMAFAESELGQEVEKLWAELLASRGG